MRRKGYDPMGADKERLFKLVEGMKGLRVGVVGDLIADIYVFGSPERVSREAPVLVVKLLKEMVLEGKIIVGDAAYCDPEICREIVDSSGDYLVIVKDNHLIIPFKIWNLHKP